MRTFIACGLSVLSLIACSEEASISKPPSTHVDAVYYEYDLDAPESVQTAVETVIVAPAVIVGKSEKRWVCGQPVQLQQGSGTVRMCGWQ